jgi:dimethylhistidine N-methyltransferase
MTGTATSLVEVVLTEQARRETLVSDVVDGLGAPPRSLPSKWLYDRRGCELFEAITELDEYYPTRAERAILAAHGDEIARASGARTVIELGSGASTKTRMLIEAFLRAGTLCEFVAFDLAETAIRDAVAVLGADYPCVRVSGVVADFERHLAHIPGTSDRLVALLGGTIGNLDPTGRKAFLDQLAGLLGPGEGVLLGVDLVKEAGRLVAAYDDRDGVTEAFEKNVLAVVNRELGADFDPGRFAYHASWSEAEERIEMGLVARGAQTVTISDLGLRVELADGEEIRTESSAKFHLAGIEAELRSAGLAPVGSWTDPAGDFALLLASSVTGR